MSSKLVKILLIVSIVGTLACVGLGVLINHQKNQYVAQLTAVEKNLRAAPPFIKYRADFKKNVKEPATTIHKINALLKNTHQELSTQTIKLERAQGELAEAVSAKEKLEIDLNVAREEANAASNDLANAQSKLATMEEELNEVRTHLKGWAPKELFEKIDALEADVKLLERKSRALADRNSQLQAQLSDKELPPGGITAVPDSLSGKVVAINKPWSFVVLNIGKKNQLREGVELVVTRGETYVGKIRTVSVDASTAVADILPDSAQGEIQIGDGVAIASSTE